MYSYEIDALIAGRSEISAEEYKEITDLNKNPQVVHIQYNPFNGKHCIWTNDGYAWSINVTPMIPKES